MLEWFLLLVKNILWPDLKTFIVKTIPHYVFDEEEMHIHITNFMIISAEAAIQRCSSK